MIGENDYEIPETKEEIKARFERLETAVEGLKELQFGDFKRENWNRDSTRISDALQTLKTLLKNAEINIHGEEKQ